MKLKTLMWSAALVAGCSSGEREVSGKLDVAGLGRSRAALVATDATGKQLTAELAPDGAFAIALPVDQAYAIAFRDPSDARQSFFANMVFGDASARRRSVRMIEGEPLEIGQVRSITARRAESGNEDGEHEGDEHEGDEHEGCRGLDVPADPAASEPATPPADGGAATALSFLTSTLVTGDVDLETENEADDSSHDGDALSDADGDDRADCHDDDRDDDGVCDDDDADHGDGSDEVDEPDGDDHDGEHAEAELPYAAELALGESFQLSLAFEGTPAEILSVEMEGGDWRLAELRSDTPFTVTEADCTHRGNRDVGRDRVFVSWRNADGSTELDHLDLRYCGR